MQQTSNTPVLSLIGLNNTSNKGLAADSDDMLLIVIGLEGGNVLGTRKAGRKLSGGGNVRRGNARG